MMLNLHVCVTILTVLGFTFSQHLYFRDIADVQNELFIKEINQLRMELVTIKERLPKRHPCPFNWSPFKTSCYLVVNENKTHEDAAMHCIGYGSKLVEIETEEENDFIIRNLINTADDQRGNLKRGFFRSSWCDNKNKGVDQGSDFNQIAVCTYNDLIQFWTGGTDAVYEESWFWSMTGTPITNKTFENWDTGEPNDVNGGEDCLEIKRLKWNDGRCNSSNLFICEKNVFY